MDISCKIKRALLVLSLICSIFCLPLSVPRAHAVDPVTVALLTPVALETVQSVQPYVLRGLSNGGNQLITMGGDVLEVLYLPWGLVQSTLGAPFGGFGGGMENIGTGLAAPFKLVFHTVMLPFVLLGF